MSDSVLLANFDGNPGITFTQGESRTIIVTLSSQGTTTPVNLTGSVVDLNLPRQGGGSIKRTSGPVAVAFAEVIIDPSNTIVLPDHGFVTGDTVQVAAQGGGTLPGGLVISTNYLILVIDVNTFQFTDTSGSLITLTSQGTIGFNITDSNDLQVTTPLLGQMTLNLRSLVSADTNAALAQTFQVSYTLAGATRIVLVQNQLDVYAQPVP